MITSTKTTSPEGKACRHCREIIPGDFWQWHPLPYCAKPECQERARRANTQFIGERQRRCEARGCTQFAPSGFFDPRQKYFVCSRKCFMKRRSRLAFGRKLVTCGCGCGQQFHSGAKPRDRYFYDRDHAGRYKTDQMLKRSKHFEPAIREYTEGFCRLHYKGVYTARLALVGFCEYLNQAGIKDFGDVTPKTVTEYLTAGRKGRHYVNSSIVSALSTFFNWQIAEGRRSTPNPIVPSIHRVPRNVTGPRPLDDKELEYAWSLAETRGSRRICLALAIGEESGLRIGEIANLRLQDVDLRKQLLYVRTPNKTNRPRYVPFGDKTKTYLDLWLRERDPNCGHDHLLHNFAGLPSTSQQIRNEFQLTMCKAGAAFRGYKRVNPDGFDQWSTHRLRHTMASRLVNGGADAATVMAVGGWRTSKSMCGYSRVNETAVQRGYDAAMKRSRESRSSGHKRVSLSDFMHNKGRGGQ